MNLRTKESSLIAKWSATALASPTSFLRGGARTAAAEMTNPPRFRKASEFDLQSSGTCEHFWNVGFCVKYQLPVDTKELCDSWVSILKSGRRQWAEP